MKRITLIVCMVIASMQTFSQKMNDDKIIIYQVFTRLFGSDANVNLPNGDKAVNGCGTMAAFSAKALGEIRNLGANYIWYTGVIEHATQTDYSAFGISRDHRAIVKGKAGSAYAIKDYYDIDPDIATSVPARMKEFERLVARTHKAGLKVIIDFVPNHVARQYHSDTCPQGIEDLGAQDDQTKAFSPANNFYYIPDQQFAADFDLQQGENSPYYERPARATGNDNFSAFAHHDDWYETVKLNYGVDYTAGRTTHFDPVPSTWSKMLGILCFWAAKGIDGFRCDMAEMVPAEFWGWAIPQVKEKYPGIIFIAEVYNPGEYRRYINEGRFDYLYDKVGLYDTLRAVTCGYSNATAITQCWQAVEDIRDHMLNFLENHDEQRIASDFFAGDGEKGRAPLLVSACMGRSPMMIYFGQELGERGMDAEGFSGRDGRTTIFDYWTVSTISRWRNKGKFDGRKLTPQESELQAYYANVLNLCNKERALSTGEFFDLMYVNPNGPHFNPNRHYAFVRRADKELIVVIANFDDNAADIHLQLPKHLFDLYGIKPKESAKATELLTGRTLHIPFTHERSLDIMVPPLGGTLLKIKI